MEDRIKFYIGSWGFVVLANCNNSNNKYIFWIYTILGLSMMFGSIKYKK
jgi:hypothetical protein